MADIPNYGALIASGQQLVPDFALQQLRERQVAVQETEAGVNAQRVAAQVAEAQREAAEQQAYQAAVAEYTQRPTMEGLAQLMVRFPSMSEAARRSFQSLDETRQRSDFQTMAQIHDALRNNRPDLARTYLQRRIQAARTSGQEVDPSEQAMLDAVQSSDPQQLAYARDVARRMTAIMAGPEQFDSVYGVDRPRYTTGAPGSIFLEENTGAVSQSPVPQIISGPGGVYERPPVAGVPLLGGVASLQGAPAPSGAPPVATGVGAFSVISSPGAPRDGGRRVHAGWDIMPTTQDRGWRPNQPFRIERPRNGPRQGLTADVVMEDGTRITVMHLQELPQAGSYPAGALAAVAGNTGNARTTPPHFHTEARDAQGRPIDPRGYFGIGGDSAGIPRVRSVQQYQRLASGTEYIDPQGVRRRKQ